MEKLKFFYPSIAIRHNMKTTDPFEVGIHFIIVLNELRIRLVDTTESEITDFNLRQFGLL